MGEDSDFPSLLSLRHELLDWENSGVVNGEAEVDSEFEVSFGDDLLDTV